MATARKPTARRRTAKPKPPQPVECPACHGTGEVSRTVRVGHARRAVGEQTGMCLACFGTGETPAD